MCTGWFVQCRPRQWVSNLRNLHKECIAPESSRPCWWAQGMLELKHPSTFFVLYHGDTTLAELINFPDWRQNIGSGWHWSPASKPRASCRSDTWGRQPRVLLGAVPHSVGKWRPLSVSMCVCIPFVMLVELPCGSWVSWQAWVDVPRTHCRVWTEMLRVIRLKLRPHPPQEQLVARDSPPPLLLPPPENF